MRKPEVVVLFAYNYWANRQIVAAAGELPAEKFTTPSTLTYRDLRGTLVHTLDVEKSWRLRLRGEKQEVWDTSLAYEDYPTTQELAADWQGDEEEMRAWLDELTDEELDGVVDLGPKDRFPLWCFLVHIVTHSAQQRRDAALLLETLGVTPPELEFLYYTDWLGERAMGERR
ncbi:MAG: DinB family protein [Actinobacteria bacterium]|nr:DinB family protein [Actinomycetota bacterium]